MKLMRHISVRGRVGRIGLGLLVLAGVAWTSTVADAIEFPDAVRAAMQEIRGREMHAHVRFLASSHLEGREAGTDGEEIAASYLSTYFQGLGLKPGGDDNGWYQYFRLETAALGDGNRFAVHQQTHGAELTRAFALEEEFLPFNFSPSGEVRAPVVFAGYGITAPEYDYDDYARVDARGKIVLVLRHEPRENEKDSRFKGLKRTRHAPFLAKVRNAQDHGAIGFLLVTDPANHEPEDQDPGNRLASWIIPDPDAEEDSPRRPRQRIEGWGRDARIPALHVHPRAVAELLRPSGRTLAVLQEQIDGTGKPASVLLPDVEATIQTAVTRDYTYVRNVVARLEGRDPALKDEVVIICGHYDHVGMGHFGSGTGHRDRIHPGADDNASGTSGIMACAKAFARLPEPPRRTVLFIPFTAEEKGLMGSRYYADHPAVPLDRTVAVFNMDMIGRNDANVVSVVGDRRARKLDALIQAVNGATLRMDINHDGGSGIDRSDQYPFARKGVPAVAFFAGVHDDYHRPSDTSGKVVAQKMENIARLVFLSAWRVAEAPDNLVRPDEAAKGD